MTVRIWSLDNAAPEAKDEDDVLARAEGRDRFCKGILKGHSKEIYTMTWNTGANGKNVLATCVLSNTYSLRAGGADPLHFAPCRGSYDETIRLWDVKSLACLRVLKAHTETVFSLSFSPSGRYLASAGWDGLLVVWNPEVRPLRVGDCSISTLADLCALLSCRRASRSGSTTPRREFLRLTGTRARSASAGPTRFSPSSRSRTCREGRPTCRERGGGYAGRSFASPPFLLADTHLAEARPGHLSSQKSSASLRTSLYTHAF